MTAITVFDLDAREDGPTFVDISPREAVIAAFAQSLGDYNTWDYDKKWGHLVTEQEATVTCGNFTARSES